MAQHENDPLFEPPLADVPHDDDAPSAPIGDATASAQAAPEAEEPAGSAPRRLLRTVGIPVALAAAGLLTGATLTGVAMAAGSDGSDGRDGTRSSISQDRGPALTIPDDDEAASDGAGSGFTLPDQPDQPGQDREGGRGSHASTGASA
jgi:hypothetical protein